MKKLLRDLEKKGWSDDRLIGSSSGVIKASVMCLSAAMVECLELANSIDPSVSGKDACLMLAAHFKKELAVFKSTSSLLGTSADMADTLKKLRQS